MRRWAMRAAMTAVVAGAAILGGRTVGSAAQKDPSATSGWVRLPAAGATSTDAYVSVDNPGMYAIYLLSASSDVAGSVELRQTGKDAALEEVTVPAYGALEMDAKGVHLLLKDLKKPLAEGDKVNLTVVTELGVKLNVQATVKKE
jgi:periplasmic copper chaperone A